jgi:murein DD-endopeptidase MepM/ murein hydrolase activator NlpD
VADRSSGVVRRATLSLRPTVTAGAVVFLIPVLIGLGARWSMRGEVSQLQAQNAALELENGSYRAATGELTTQIQSLEGVIDDLGTRATLNPAEARAIQRLPAIVKAKAAGGTTQPNAALSGLAATALASPEDTFGLLKDVLQGLESRLSLVRKNVERREALASATPSIWPAHGWLTGQFGGRADPFTGEQGFHQGIDISTEKGEPIYATADGVVETAAWAGDYGNMILLDHGFGLKTRYGHLSAFEVKAGSTVRRGDVIGLVGSTGRSTGAHLHYEILVNDRLINPLSLLTQPANR